MPYIRWQNKRLCAMSSGELKQHLKKRQIKGRGRATTLALRRELLNLKCPPSTANRPRLGRKLSQYDHAGRPIKPKRKKTGGLKASPEYKDFVKRGILKFRGPFAQSGRKVKSKMLRIAAAYGYPVMMDALLQNMQGETGRREKIMEAFMRASVDCDILFVKYNYKDKGWTCGVPGENWSPPPPPPPPPSPAASPVELVRLRGKVVGRWVKDSEDGKFKYEELSGGGGSYDAVERWMDAKGAKHVARADYDEASRVVLAGGGDPRDLNQPSNTLQRGSKYSAWMAQASRDAMDNMQFADTTNFDGHSWVRDTIYFGDSALPFRLLTLSGN